MTTPTPTPENQNSPDASDSEETQNVTGFFNRVQQELKPEPIHPTEAAEIVILEEEPHGNQ